MRRYLRNLDWILIWTVLLLCVTGMVLIASATHGDALVAGHNRFVQRQGIFLLVDVLLAIGIISLDYHSLKRIALPLYGFTVLLLLGVMFFGHASLGAQRWIQIGPVTFQPSEFSKAFMIVCLAAFLDERSEYLEQWRDYLPACLFILIPFVLVLRQPDLGTALVFAAIAFSMFWVCGFKVRWIAVLAGVFACAAPVLWQFLHEYQRNRIRVFLDPELDPFDCHRQRHAVGQRLDAGNPEPAGFFAGEPYGFYLCGSRGRVRFCRCCYHFIAVYDINLARHDDCAERGGPLWRLAGHRHHGYVSVPRAGKRGYDHRHHAGDGGAAAVSQLRGQFPDYQYAVGRGIIEY